MHRVLIVAGALLAVAAPAQAQVVVDPDSPTGKEYALPLEAARQQARGGPGQAPGATGAPAPLFGVGIGGDSRPAAGGRASGEGDGRGGTGRGGSRSSAEDEPGAGLSASARGALRRATSNPGAPRDGWPPPLLIGVVAFGLLAAGAAAGFVARRRGRA